MADVADQVARYVQESTADGKSKVPGCRWFLDKAFFCVTPLNQMTHYYRTGTADECKGTFVNMYNCLRASMMDEEKALEFLKDTAIDPSRPPHKVGVWEMKETPGW
ncbi:TPA: hypothetical protein N0F65_008741 [Lagenidium giganteum]|uniref:Uncharacterized protein n=1 Tax=Lagenidium giganteum TaxID=4803 RepID=A0AAV2Z2T9_9STRA|nr:TPA: hypothetical protein N0F65_008741 [Lagenidium giganteum]